MTERRFMTKAEYSNRIIKLSLFIACFFYNVSVESAKIKAENLLNVEACRKAFYQEKRQKLLNPLHLFVETTQNSRTPLFNTFQISGEADLQNSSNEPVFHQTRKEVLILNPHYYTALIQVLSPIITSHRKGVIITSSLQEAEQLKIVLKTTFINVEFEVSHFLLSPQEKQKIRENSNSAQSHYIIIPRIWEAGMHLAQTSVYITINANIPIEQMLDEARNLLIPHSEKKTTHAFFLTHNEGFIKARNMGILLDILEKKAYLNEKENGKDNEGFHVSISDSFKEYIQGFLKNQNRKNGETKASNQKSWVQGSQ